MAVFKLKDRIFALYGRYIAQTDSYKNVEGKGLLQRYNEQMADDYDTMLAPKINGMVDNTLVPYTALLEFIPYLEYQIGGSVFLGSDEILRRKAIRYATRLYQIKGTKLSYEVCMKMLGFSSVVLVQHDNSGTFDSGNTTSSVPAEPYFDDYYRRFDGACPGCTDYSVYIYGSLLITDELHKAIFRAITFCQPIVARLRDVYYNDTLLIADELVSIFVDVNGDLNFDNVAVPDVEFNLTADGDLETDTPGYSINSNGDLIA